MRIVEVGLQGDADNAIGWRSCPYAHELQQSLRVLGEQKELGLWALSDPIENAC